MSKVDTELKKLMLEYQKLQEELRKSVKEGEIVFSKSPIAGFPAIRKTLDYGVPRK